MGTQQSKRMRKGLRKFRAFKLNTKCKCGAKIPMGSHHHYLCQKCWRKQNEKRLKDR